MFELITFGEICPLPLLKAIEKYKEMGENDILKVVVDHSCTLGSIREYFSKLNCSVEIDEVLNGVWEIYIKKRTLL
nr:sulfurtransferase TusA family protein [Caldicoprobacter algeriensis]